MTNLKLILLPDLYAICRLDSLARLPTWAQGPFVATARSGDELSVVCPQVRVPSQIPAQRDWRCLQVAGPLDFSMTGILASLSGALAARQVSVFAISTFDTDYLLVREGQLETATAALADGGYVVEPQDE